MMATKNPDDFGDGQSPTTVTPNPEEKSFRVTLKDGSLLNVKAFRLFTSYDANLGLVVRAMRSNDSEVGVFYAPLGWTLNDPAQWANTP